MKSLQYREPPWPVRIAITACMSFAAGLFVMPEGASSAVFWKFLLYAQCIGFSVMAAYTALCLLLPGSALSPMLRIVLLVLSVPLGYETGMAVAAILHGDPVKFGAIFRMSRPAVVILSVTALIAIILGGSRWRIAELSAAQAESQKLATEAQLRLLQAQLEPHMLFNTLANLHSLIEVDPARAQAMVEHLIDFMRSTLSTSRKEFASLQEEFRLLSAYLELMKIRMESRLSYQLQLPDALAQVRIPAMLLQPLVENAIKHGLEPQVDGGTIRVAADSAGQHLQVSIRDTGRGLNSDQNDKSYGMTHVRERLQVLYGDQASLTLEEIQPHGVLATVRIPL